MQLFCAVMENEEKPEFQIQELLINSFQIQTSLRMDRVSQM